MRMTGRGEDHGKDWSSQTRPVSANLHAFPTFQG